MHYKNTSINNPELTPDNILNKWILFITDNSYNEWLTAYLHGGVKYPPKFEPLAGSLFYVESICSSFASGRFIESLLNPIIINLAHYEYLLAPKSMVDPFLETIYNKVKVQNSAPIDIFPQMFKDYYNAKVTNETN